MSNNKVILCLDAGGNNFVFSAYKNYNQIVDSIRFKAITHNLNDCINLIIQSFEKITNTVNTKPDAISIGFPGPADYKQGIIGDLYNLPCFRGGVPLAHILSKHFKIPVYINNDGDLYCLGEAKAGSLPYINKLLNKHKNNKQYKNLCGLTLGTGLGGGIVNNGNLLTGDNISAAEVWRMSNRVNCNINSEEAISIRAVKRMYAKEAGINIDKAPEPKNIYKIGIGKEKGDKKAAIKAFYSLGRHLGDVIANLININDGIVVIGGGLAGAKDLIIPGVREELNNEFINYNTKINRLTHKVYCLNNDDELKSFLKDDSKIIKLEKSNKNLYYQAIPKAAYIFSNYNTSTMIHAGAYHFAIEELSKTK